MSAPAPSPDAISASSSRTAGQTPTTEYKAGPLAKADGASGSGPAGGGMQPQPHPQPGAGGSASASASAVGSGSPAGPGRPGGPGGRRMMKKYSHGFWDPEMKPLRGVVLKILGPASVLLIIIMWLCLPFYWGSLWLSNVYTNKLDVRIIDRDGSTVGAFVTQQLLTHDNLGYFTSSASDFPTEQDVADDVVDEGTWAAIVIQAGATANLTTARQNGMASYNGSHAIYVYYSQARQETAENSYLVPYIQQTLGQITGQLSGQLTAQYLSANSGNATAMALLAQAPTTLVQPIFYTMANLRPYNQPVAQAITLVGLIYMLIFGFIITMANNGAREVIGPFLTTRSYIGYRLLAPLALYLPLSFFFAMINLPFKVDFNAHYTYAGGFFLWAFTLYLGMAAVGLATEFAITILGPKFTGFFLIPLIIANVSVASLPNALQPWIFRYGVAMPFYNVGRVVRTIIFNTKNDIAMNIGILLAWIAFSCITIPLATWLYRRKAINEHMRGVGESELDREKQVQQAEEERGTGDVGV